MLTHTQVYPPGLETGTFHESRSGDGSLDSHQSETEQLLPPTLCIVGHMLADRYDFSTVILWPDALLIIAAVFILGSLATVSYTGKYHKAKNSLSLKS